MPLPVVHYYSAGIDPWACGRGGGGLFALQSASPQRVFPCRSSITCRQADVHAAQGVIAEAGHGEGSTNLHHHIEPAHVRVA